MTNVLIKCKYLVLAIFFIFGSVSTHSLQKDGVQLSLLDAEQSDLTAYAVDDESFSYETNTYDGVTEVHYYFGVFQAGRIHEKENCTPRSIDDFPPDIFTEEQRQHGAIIVHFLFVIYSMVMICTAVDDFFVPSLEIFATAMNMSPDVAGATIMAIGTSIPELFFNIIGTFITQGDIGIGTVVGSDVFNILAAPAYCGILSGIVVDVDWYSLTRDCLFYGVVVILQIIFVSDEYIFWWEAMILVIGYGFYILVMFFNENLEKKANNLVDKFCCFSIGTHRNAQPDTSSSTTIDIAASNIELPQISSIDQAENKIAQQNTEAITSEESTPIKLFQRPEGSFLKQLFFYVMWPSNFLFLITIPDVRRGGIWAKLYVLEFATCIIWVGGLSYLVTWWITVIGDTIGVPDSEMGITILAMGGSIPQGYALYIVARQGKGKMGISGAVGSNAFDMMICMGLPWFIKSLASPIYPDEGKFVVINSGGVVYSVSMLLCAVIIFYFTIAFNKWRLDRKAGIILVSGYATFVILASLFELNVFFEVNTPTCK